MAASARLLACLLPWAAAAAAGAAVRRYTIVGLEKARAWWPGGRAAHVHLPHVRARAAWAYGCHSFLLQRCCIAAWPGTGVCRAVQYSTGTVLYCTVVGHAKKGVVFI